MGDVVRLSDARAARRSGRRGQRRRAEFFFDLACPFSYLAAERVERTFDDVTWTPASAAALQRGTVAGDDPWHERVRAAADRRARELRLPLMWPDPFAPQVPAAMRAAAFAAERGRGAAFVLAAGRLAYAGGFDLEDPEVLAEAAAAGGVPLQECHAAAGDAGRDGRIEATGRRLLAAGADRLPALRVGRALFWGERRLAAAVAAAQVSATAR